MRTSKYDTDSSAVNRCLSDFVLVILPGFREKPTGFRGETLQVGASVSGGDAPTGASVRFVSAPRCNAAAWSCGLYRSG